MRENLKGGKEIVKAVLRYRRLLESESQTILSVPIKDPRTEDEKVADVKLQDIAHRFHWLYYIDYYVDNTWKNYS